MGTDDEVMDNQGAVEVFDQVPETVRHGRWVLFDMHPLSVGAPLPGAVATLPVACISPDKTRRRTRHSGPALIVVRVSGHWCLLSRWRRGGTHIGLAHHRGSSTTRSCYQLSMLSVLILHTYHVAYFYPTLHKASACQVTQGPSPEPETVADK